MDRVGAAILASILLFFGVAATARSENFLLAEGRAWPGRVWLARSGVVEPFYLRGRVAGDDVPRVQSLSVLRPGNVVFCSGLDRSLLQITPMGERRLHDGGYLARQVRVSPDGTVFFSGLETPHEGQRLPDGFIYSLNPTTGELRTLLTFSQGDVGRDWWGAFDIHGGEVYVGTLASPSRIYVIRASLPRHVTTLNFSATAFRFSADGSLLACNGQGQLFRIANLDRPEQVETVLDVSTPFVDFTSTRGL
jgi:hypothetical protein